MTHLSAMQMAVVGAPADLPDGAEWPVVRYEIHDLGEMSEELWERINHGHLLGERTPEGQAPPVAGYSAVFTREGKWFARRESDGGSSSSCAFDTREEVESYVRNDIDQVVGFWMEKVGWRIAGDLTTSPTWDRRRDKSQVIRCGGVHYTLGREPSGAELCQNRQYGGLGFGGRQMAFRLLADGRRVQSRNCWYQGRIPAEFLALLLDNAEAVESDDLIAERARADAWREEQAAQSLARAWKDEALRAWRGHPAELASHELLVAWDAAEVEQDRQRREEWDAQTLAASWRDEAYRSWRGTWWDLLSLEQEIYEQEQEYMAEMWADYYGGLL